MFLDPENELIMYQQIILDIRAIADEALGACPESAADPTIDRVREMARALEAHRAAHEAMSAELMDCRSRLVTACDLLLTYSRDYMAADRQVAVRKVLG